MTSASFNAIDTCLRHLSMAVSTANLYGLEHNQIKLLCQKAQKALMESLAASQEISLIRVDDQLAVDGKPLPGKVPVQLSAHCITPHPHHTHERHPAVY